MNNLKKRLAMALSLFTVIGYSIWKFTRGLGRTIAKLWKNPKGKVGLIGVGLLVFVALLIGIIDPNKQLIQPAFGLENVYQAPSFKHLFGTDGEGKDILLLIMHGTQVSLLVGILTALGVTLLGATLGIIAGYFGKWVDTIIMRVVDVMLVIPSLPLMLLIHSMISYMGQYRFYHLILIFIILGWAGTARTIRAQVLSLKEANFIKAAELAGASRGYVMFKHILPGVSHLLIMNTAMSSAGFMVAEAGLAFIGLSDAYAESWGKMITSAQGGFTYGAWWAILAPGLAIFIAVMAFMQLGLALEGIWNPRMGNSEKVFKLFKRLDPNYIGKVFDAMDIEGDEIPSGLAVKVETKGGGKNGK